MTLETLRRGALVSCLLCAVASAQNPQPPIIDPKADALLSRMCKLLADARQFSLESSTLADEVTPTGQKLQYAKQSVISIRRPDGLRAVVKGDRENFVAVYDGKRVVFHDPASNQYAGAAMPDTIDAAVDTLAQKYGLVAPLADFLFSDPRESLASRVQAGLYVGEGLVNGVPCHHLAFRQESVDWQIWIATGDQPLPRKFVIDYKLLPGSPQFIAVLDKWNLSPAFGDSEFKFTPPAGAEETELKPLAPAAAQPER